MIELLQMYPFMYSFAIAGLITCLILLYKSVFLVRQAETVVIERLGKFHTILTPGLHFIIPFFDNPRSVTWTVNLPSHYHAQKVTYRIDLRETVDDFPKQNVITKDNVTIEINGILYYHLFDAELAVYQVADLPQALEKLAQTTLRNVIGSMDLDETLSSRDQINEKLRIILDEATDSWGVKVDRVELQEINPPSDIRHAMEKQMRAERDRRAVILEAEGKKRASILEAEGVQESQILRAKGESESKIVRAQGEAQARKTFALAEAQAIEQIKQVIPESEIVNYMVATQYIKNLPELMKGKDDKLIVVPYEASSFAGAFAGIKKLLEHTGK